MSIFHYSEFLAIAWSNPNSLSTSSFILNHSLHYALAAISSWIEFLVEVNFWPEIKEYWLVTIVGVVMCVGGELLRKLAIITANTNFNHIVSKSITNVEEIAKRRNGKVGGHSKIFVGTIGFINSRDRFTSTNGYQFLLNFV